ncbi:MAG: LTA synthase family protein, partial [Synergistaceae bacterium]
MEYNKIGNGYRRAGKDYREPVFLFLLVVFIYLKFYFLEYTVSHTAARSVFSAFSSLGISLMLVSFISLFWRKLRPVLLFALDFSLSGLVFTDLMHLRYYSDLFTFGNIGLSTQVGEVAESVAALFRPSDLFYFADIILLAFYFLFFRRMSVKPFFKKITFRRIKLTLYVFFIGAALCALRIYTYENKVPGVLRSMWDRPAVCNNVGAMTYHAVDFWNVASDKLFKKKLPQTDVDEIREWFVRQESLTDKSADMYGKYAGKNLIIIQVESLQHFVIGMKVGGAEVTPNINRFVKKSAYFTEVYNQTGSGNSSDAEFLVNAALYPSPSGVAYTRFAGNDYAGLPKVLANRGYSVFALHGDRPGFWNRQHMYPALGFQRFVSKKDFVADENLGMGLSDKSFFRQTIPILKKEPKPFYAFLITLTSHYPYNFPELLRQCDFNAGEFDGLLVGNYLKAINYFDRQFGMFIKGLEKEGLLNSSIIIVYGDHTAIPEWDKPNLERLLNRDLKERNAWRSILKIPLIIRFPDGRFAGTADNSPAGLVDVSKTVT